MSDNPKAPRKTATSIGEGCETTSARIPSRSGVSSALAVPSINARQSDRVDRMDRDVHERGYADQSVRRYQARLEEAQELAHLGFWEFDPSTGTGFWSKEMYPLFDRDPADGPPTAAEFWEMVHTEDRDAVMRTYRRVDETGKQERREYRVVTPSGSRRNLEMLLKLVEGAQGPILIGTVLDVTERKQARVALRERERQLSTVFNNTYDQQALLSIGSDGEFRIEAINDSSTRVVREFGYSITEDYFVGKTVEEALMGGLGLGRDFIDRTLDNLRRVVASNQAVFFDQALTVENHQYYTEAIVTPIPDEHGKCKYILYTSHNITERKRAEQELRNSEARLKDYIECAPDGIFVFDEEGRTLEVNPAAGRITGYSKDELMKMRFIALIHPDDQQKGTRHFSDVRRTGQATVELRFIKKDGSLRYSIVDTVGLSGSRFLGFTKDITEQKEAQQALIESKERLQQAEKMQAVGQLAGGIAHDFNNQLASLLGYADLIRDGVTDDPRLTQYADSIIVGIKRASELTAQLLAFARKGKYLMIPVDIHRIVSEVVNLLNHSIDKRVVIQQHLAAHPSTTLGDPTQLQNAVLNLALNACDAMPSGGNLVFTTEVVELDKSSGDTQPFGLSPGRYLTVSVHDTGIGIEEGNLQRIFEPFFTTKKAGEGTGMGLAGVYGTATSHRGAIFVTSIPSQGSTFRLYLPLLETENRPNESEVDEQRSVEDIARILLVEDDDRLREVTVLLLEDLGHTVKVCSNGAEAVEQYREHWRSIDLVILDMVMPGMGGKQTFHALREINPDVLVLLSSGYSLEGEAQTILEEGAQAFIQKPYRTEILSQKISELLHLRNKKISRG